MQASVRERKAASGRSPAEERAEGLQDLRDSIALHHQKSGVA